MGSSLARASAIAPDPVPTSAILGAFIGLASGRDGFDQVLGFGARDEDRGRHDQVEPPEFLVAGDVLRGDALGALCQGFVVAGLLFGGEFALGMGEQVGAVAVEGEYEKRLCIQARGGDMLVAEPGDGGLQGFTEEHSLIAPQILSF